MLFPLATTAAMEPFPYLAGLRVRWWADCRMWALVLLPDFRTDAAGRTGQRRPADAGGLCDYGVVLAAAGSPVAESAADGILSQAADIKRALLCPLFLFRNRVVITDAVYVLQKLYAFVRKNQ